MDLSLKVLLQGPTARAALLILMALLMAAPGGCGSGPAGVESEPTRAIEVTVTTSGEDLDPDGYTLRVYPGSGATAVGVEGQVRLEEMAPGTYTLKLEDTQYNCFPERPQGWTATVVAGATEQLTLAVSCDRQRWEVQQLASVGKVKVDFISPEVGRAVIRGNNPAFLWTTDGGRSWQSRTVSATGDQGSLFAFPTESFGLIGGQGCTLMRTTDAGATWTRVRVCASETSRYLFSSLFVDDRTGWIAGGGGMLFSTADGGETWKYHDDLNDASYFMPVSGIAFMDASTGLLVGSDGAGAVFRTTDGGDSWQRQATGIDKHLQGVSFGPDNVAVAVGQTGTILRTTDAGQSWTRIEGGFQTDLWDVQLNADGFGVAVGQDGLVLVTRDAGLTWKREAVDFTEVLHDVDILSSTEVWVAGGRGTVAHRVID